MNSPILVTGSHRSGSTWVGRMLCASREAFYVHEPFNEARSGPRWIPGGFPYWFYHISLVNADKYEERLLNVIELHYPLFRNALQIRSLRHVGRLGRDWLLSKYARLLGKRPLIKDPIALFSAEWLASRFDMKVIVMIRHPAGFASSLKRLNWQFDFSNWLSQDLLMRDYLSPFRDQIIEYSRNKKKDIIDQAILMWNVIYSVVHRYRQTYPDWMFVRHEDLAANPLEGFERLYQYCGLTWNKRAKSVILAHSAPTNPKEVSPGDPGTIRRDSQATIRTWKKRLTQEEIERIREGTEEISSLFYKDAEWN